MDDRIVACQVCGKEMRLMESMPAEMVRESVAALIRKDLPGWTLQGFICKDDLSIYRAKLVREVFLDEIDETNSIEADVAKSIAEQELLSKNINDEFDAQSTLGQRVSDRVASFGGSWRFIGIFMGVIVVWVIVNSIALIMKPFDAYPFIFLNLVLSCVAAIQAPVIMMSQNRQGEKDRMRSEHDYRINLKAEFEIQTLHEKIDHMLVHQWQRLMEIQQVQTDVLEELRQRGKES